MSIHNRFFDKYSYKITHDRIREFDDRKIHRSKVESHQAEVLKPDWDDFQFLIRVDSQYIITGAGEPDDRFIVTLFRKRKGLRFRVIEDVNLVNHPWIDQVLDTGEVPTQINY